MTVGKWSKLELAGHSCTSYEPAHPSAHEYMVLHLPGERRESLAACPLAMDEIERHGLRVLVPEGDCGDPQTDPRIAAARHVLEILVPAVRARWRIEPPGIALLGADLGGEQALRLAFKHPDTFPVVAALDPAIDYYLLWDQEEALQRLYADPEAARQESSILHIHPLYWPRNIWFASHPGSFWYGGADRLRMKLGALGIPHACELDLEPQTPKAFREHLLAEKALPFLYDRLERERLRVR